MTREEAISIVRNSALSQHTDYLVSLFRPSARLQLHSSGDGLPQSFLGGLPLLPNGFEWPHWDRRERLLASIDRWERLINPAPQYQWIQDWVEGWKQRLNDGPMPLTFLGQIFLRELANSIPLQGWPTIGSLAFFFGDTAMPGYSVANRGHCRVLYVPEGEALHPTGFPKALANEFRHPRFQASFNLEWTLPGEPLDLASNAFMRGNPEYRRLLGSLMSWQIPPDQAPHRCAGYPQQIQGPMEDECQLTAEQITWTQYKSFDSNQKNQIHTRGRDWQLLVQFASDKRLGWTWNDAGLVYFWVRSQELAKLNFEETLAIVQSG